ncbi:MAG: hypothetical protein IPJ26_17350 [Bacteroidetes bacterium]|nr:hypothetical protein [Bacteroidota bacterium]
MNSNHIDFTALDISAETKYKGGDVIVKLNLRGNGSSLKRNEITQLKLYFENPAFYRMTW